MATHLSDSCRVLLCGILLRLEYLDLVGQGLGLLLLGELELTELLRLVCGYNTLLLLGLN